MQIRPPNEAATPDCRAGELTQLSVGTEAWGSKELATPESVRESWVGYVCLKHKN